jgi:hypothetical protein
VTSKETAPVAEGEEEGGVNEWELASQNSSDFFFLDSSYVNHTTSPRFNSGPSWFSSAWVPGPVDCCCRFSSTLFVLRALEFDSIRHEEEVQATTLS